MHTARIVYNVLVLPALLAGGRLASPLSPKLREGIRGRRGLWRRLERTLADLPPGRPRVWFHAASVGEFEQARPVIEGLLARPAPPAVVATLFSPSGVRYARALDGPDYPREYLPFDTARNARRIHDLVRPSLLVFVKFDLWPNMIWEARRRGTPVLLIDGTLSRGSRRLLPLVRDLYGSLYRNLEGILAISEEDADRFRSCLDRRNRVRVTGDTRYDQVLLRRDRSSAVPLPPALSAPGGPVWVVGSSWPPDERLVVPAFAQLLRRHPSLVLLLAPHEPTPLTLARLESRLRAEGITSVRYSRAESGRRAPAILVDRVGILAEIYRAGSFAFVGGAFGTGLHNVMEPAAMGLPLFFGPRFGNSHEAGLLLEAGAARVTRTVEDLVRGIGRLLDDEERRRQSGEAARLLIERHRGAVGRCLGSIGEILARREPGA